MDWLLKYGWISEEEKDQGPLFLREFTIFPLPFTRRDVNSNWIRTGASASPLGDKNYILPRSDFDDHKVFGQFQTDHRFCDWQYCWESLYNVPKCEKQDKMNQRRRSRIGGEIIPSIFSTWTISQSLYRYKDSLAAAPFPDGIFYLQAQIQVCFGPVGSLKTKPKMLDRRIPVYYPSLTTPTCPSPCASPCENVTNAYFDQLGKGYCEDQLCPQCPSGSVPRLNGYYCEKCPPGTELSETSMGCLYSGKLP